MKAMTTQLQRYPYASVILVYVVLAMVYAMTLAMPGGFVERTVEGIGALFPALIVGALMAHSAKKKGNPQPAAAALKGVVVVGGLVMGFLWLS